MSFPEYIKEKAICHKCEKPFDNIRTETELETGDLIITADCHGEKMRERVTKYVLNDLEAKKNSPKKRRIVTVDQEIYKFNKFRRLK